MKIGHISDLHLCRNFKKTNIGKTKTLIQHAIEISGINHLIITGDISDNSQAQDYLTLKRILSTLGFYDINKTSLVIGNHDVYGGVQKLVDLLHFFPNCNTLNYNEKVANFNLNFKELFPINSFYQNAPAYPFVKELNNFILIGVNSIGRYSKFRNTLASNGEISNDEFNKIKNILENSSYKEKIKIILIHHHFYNRIHEDTTSSHPFWNFIEGYTLKLNGKRKLINMFEKNNVHLVLHGHSHEWKEYSINNIRFLNAGASIENFYSEEVGYFLIEITEKQIKSSLIKFDYKDYISKSKSAKTK